MFLRKLTVVVVPLLLASIVCALLPLVGLGNSGFITWVLQGVVLGTALALLLPVSGAVRKREPFAGLLWIPALLLTFTVAYQYMSTTGVWSTPLLSMLETNQPNTIMIECTFIGFMAATCIRTVK